MNENEIIIDEICITPIKPQPGGLVAFASCIINKHFYIGNIAIYTAMFSEYNYRLVYPNKILSNGKEVSCIHPINKNIGEAMIEAIVGEYQNLINNQKTQ